MSSNNFYLVVRDVKTNDYEAIKEFETLKEADLYTTSYHSNKDLAKNLWSRSIIPSQDLDFFIVNPLVSDEKTYFKVMEVLFSDSKEVRSIIQKNNSKGVESVVTHFFDKMRHNIDFYNMVMSDSDISDDVKIHFYYDDYSRVINPESIPYSTIRNMVSSFSTFEKSKDLASNKNYRLLLEREMKSKVDYDERQINMFSQIEKDEVNVSKLIEVLDTFENLPVGFIYIKEGVAHISNNMLTMTENLDYLDSLLNQDLLYTLDANIKYRDLYNNSESIEDHFKYKNLLKENKTQMIEILSGNRVVLEKAHKLTNIVKKNQSNLLGDDYGYQYRK